MRSLILAAAVLTVGVAETGAAPLVATAPQSGFADFTVRPVPIATFDFTGQAIDLAPAGRGRIRLRLTMADGDTRPGGFDEGELSLALDGIPTGILLDGFPDDREQTRTFVGGPFTAAMKAALRADGKLEATIVDASPLDNFLSLPASAEARLTITPVPAAAALLAAALAGLGLAAARRRRA